MHIHADDSLVRLPQVPVKPQGVFQSASAFLTTENCKS